MSQQLLICKEPVHPARAFSHRVLGFLVHEVNHFVQVAHPIEARHPFRSLLAQNFKRIP